MPRFLAAWKNTAAKTIWSLALYSQAESGDATGPRHVHDEPAWPDGLVNHACVRLWSWEMPQRGSTTVVSRNGGMDGSSMTERRDVTIFYDERMLEHRPEASDEFLPGRLADRVHDILEGLPFTWTYPEVPGRLAAIMDQLTRAPVPGVRLEPGSVATREQLARVHTTSYLDSIYALRGKSA